MKRRSHCGCFLLLVVLGILGLSGLGFITYLALLPQANKCNHCSEAGQYIGSINRAQTQYFLEKREFANNIRDLGLGIKTQTELYNYSVDLTHLSAISYAASRNPKLTSYVGRVFSVSLTGDQRIEIVCQSKKVGIGKPIPPQVSGNRIHCGQGTKLVDSKVDVRNFKLSDDLALTYKATDQIDNNQFQQALQTSTTIQSSELKNYILALIAAKMASRGSWNKAWEITQAIEPLYVRNNVQKNLEQQAERLRLQALLAIANETASRSQVNRSVTVYSRVLQSIKASKYEKNKKDALERLNRTLTTVLSEADAYPVRSQILAVAKTIKYESENEEESALYSIYQEQQESIVRLNDELIDRQQYYQIPKLVEQIPDAVTQFDILVDIANQLMEEKAISQAMQTFRRSIDTAKKIQRLHERVSALDTLSQRIDYYSMHNECYGIPATELNAIRAQIKHISKMISKASNS